MNLSVRQLKAFLGVAEAGNFTKAAQKLHMSQAALSSSIHELELQLSSRLFERTRRSVSLTPAGHAFLPTAQGVVREIGEAHLRLQALERDSSKHLRLGFTPIIATHVVPQVLLQLRAARPDVHVDIVDATPRELQPLVEEGELDAAFGTFFERFSGIGQSPLFPSALVVAYAATEFDLSRSDCWKSLSGLPFIVLPDESPLQQRVKAACREFDLEPQRMMVVNQLETMIAMAGKGFGIAIVPSFAAAACRHHDVSTKQLTPVVNLDYCRIMRLGHGASDALDAFTGLLSGEIGNGGGG